MKQNKTILICSSCEKPLVNMGSKVMRIHPIARFITNYSFDVVVWSGFISIIAVIIIYNLSLFVNIRWGGFVLLSMLAIPSVIMYFLLRCFNLYRVTDCLYCEFYHAQKLGRSSSSG